MTNRDLQDAVPAATGGWTRRRGEFLSAQERLRVAGFDDPPRRLHALHDAERLLLMWMEILMRLARRPVCRRDKGDSTVIDILGQMRVVRMPDGKFHGHLRVPHHDAQWMIVRDDDVTVGAVAWREGWKKALTHLLVPPQRDGEGLPAEVHEYARWAAGQLYARARRHPLFGSIDAAIASAVQVDPSVLAIARRIPFETGHRDAWHVRASVYNRVVQARGDYEKLARESANLLPLFGVLSANEAFPDRGEPAERLRDYLWTRGLSPAGWRIVARSPARLWLRHLPHYDGSVASAVVDVLRLIDLLRGRDAPAPWFVSAVIATCAEDRSANFLDGCARRMRLLQRLAHVVELADEPTRERMRGQSAGVIDWILDWEQRPTAAEARAIGWEGFVRRATDWDDDRRRRLSDLRWPVPFARRPYGELDAVPLSSEYDLWQEGRAMRHCIANYAEPCRTGEAIVVSIRRNADGRRLCTALYWMEDGHWELGVTEGFANGVPPPASQRVAESLPALLDAAPVPV